MIWVAILLAAVVWLAVGLFGAMLSWDALSDGSSGDEPWWMAAIALGFTVAWIGGGLVGGFLMKGELRKDR